jgi:hypothetical protein
LTFEYWLFMTTMTAPPLAAPSTAGACDPPDDGTALAGSPLAEVAARADAPPGIASPAVRTNAAAPKRYLWRILWLTLSMLKRPPQAQTEQKMIKLLYVPSRVPVLSSYAGWLVLAKPS